MLTIFYRSYIYILHQFKIFIIVLLFNYQNSSNLFENMFLSQIKRDFLNDD